MIKQSRLGDGRGITACQGVCSYYTFGSLDHLLAYIFLSIVTPDITHYHGRSCDLIPAEFTSTGRGAMANRYIGPDDVIVSGELTTWLMHCSHVAVPRDMLITMQEVMSSEIGPYLGDDDGTTLALSLFLLHERAKRDRSQWKPYIDILPTSYTTAGVHVIFSCCCRYEADLSMK